MSILTDDQCTIDLHQCVFCFHLRNKTINKYMDIDPYTVLEITNYINLKFDTYLFLNCDSSKGSYSSWVVRCKHYKLTKHFNCVGMIQNKCCM